MNAIFWAGAHNRAGWLEFPVKNFKCLRKNNWNSENAAFGIRRHHCVSRFLFGYLVKVLTSYTVTEHLVFGGAHWNPEWHRLKKVKAH